MSESLTRGQRMIEAALAYRERGYRPIPVSEGTKKAHVKWKEFQTRMPTEVEIQGWWTRWPNDNIALVTGADCGIMVVDVDGPVGAESLSQLGELPKTRVNRTGGGGWHYLFQHPGGHVKTCTGIAPKVDIRADGGYIVVAPSRHPGTGVEYRWDDERGPATPLAPAPPWLLDTIAGAAPQVGGPVGDTRIAKGNRNTRLTKIAGRMLGQGQSREATLSHLLEVNQQQCSPPLPEKELESIVRSIAEAEAQKAQTNRDRPAKASSPARGQPTFQRLSDVKPTNIDWLWKGYIPLGKVTIILGDPGQGKSTFTLDLAARVTTGALMPDGSSGHQGGVVLLSAEDSASDTVAPRFEAAGGDADRVLLMRDIKLPDGTTRLVSLPEDIPHLREAIREAGARLVVVDPLAAYLSPDVNSWRDQDVRQALTPLASLAEETGAAVAVVAHLNKKSGASPMYRGGGSIGIIAASRAAFLVAKYPEDESRRVLAPVKFNVGPRPESRTFQITDAANGSSRVVWGETTQLQADQLLEPPKMARVDAAVEFLRDELADGPQSVTVIEELAGKAGHSRRTLDRARKRLGVLTRRIGYQGRVELYLPEGEVKKNGSQ